MQTTAVYTGIPWDARTAYERWVEDELKLPLTRGYAAGGLRTAALEWWSDRGIFARFYDLIGAESLAGMFVGELAPKQSSESTRQLYDEVIYVIEGEGSTTLELGGRTLAFEWGPHSLFAIPLNAPYRLHNGSASTAARFVSVNTLPVVFNLYRDPAFIFGTGYDFERVGAIESASDAVLYRPDESHERTAVDLYETLFVPDIKTVPLSKFAERGDGAHTAYFELANSNISAHIAGFRGGTFINPHRHGPSAFVFTLEGTGYTLAWREPESMVRFDWPAGDLGVVVPPNFWWHGHFLTSPEALQLAIKLRSRKYPLNHLYEKTHKLVAEGGTVLRYTDLEPALRNRIWDTYVEECARTGLKVETPTG